MIDGARMFSDGSIEVPCRWCREPLLMHKGDRLHVVVGDFLFEAECDKCGRKAAFLDKCDSNAKWIGDDPDFPPVAETTK